jgi:hypothetical protein
VSPESSECRGISEATASRCTATRSPAGSQFPQSSPPATSGSRPRGESRAGRTWRNTVRRVPRSRIKTGFGQQPVQLLIEDVSRRNWQLGSGHPQFRLTPRLSLSQRHWIAPTSLASVRRRIIARPIECGKVPVGSFSTGCLPEKSCNLLTPRGQPIDGRSQSPNSDAAFAPP